MKRILIFSLILSCFGLTGTARCYGDSPKQVIEEYYNLMMNSCWCCHKDDWSCPNNPLFQVLLTKEFNTNFGLNESLYPSLPLKINHCKATKSTASCDVTYFIIGEWNGYDPFCERHIVETVTFKLIKESEVWKISSIVKPRGVEINGDNSKVVSVPYILRDINRLIKYNRENLKEGNYNELIWHNKEEWVKHVKESIEALTNSKKAIQEIESKALKFGLKNDEIFVKDLACPIPPNGQKNQKER